MPIVTAQRKKQRTLIAIMGLVVLVSLGVLFLGTRGDKDSSIQIVDPNIPIDILIIPNEIKLELDLFQDPRFENLIPYEKIPQNIETGRNNPFLPYVLPVTETEVNNSTSTEQ